jgi:hypothetical protein
MPNPRELLASAYICSSATDQLMLGRLQKSVVMACFVLEDGSEIWYRPMKGGKRWAPISGTCGKEDVDVS